MTTPQEAVAALQAAADAYHGKIAEIESTVESKIQELENWKSNTPLGVVIQVKGVGENNSWSCGHANKFILPLSNVQLVTRSANSDFDISGFFFTDDTNSSHFGSGIGVDVSSDGGSSWQEIISPAHHSIYQSGGYDTYQTNYLTTLWDASHPVGTSLRFRLTGRFYNSNAQSFNGNSQSNDNLGLIVREVNNG